MNTNMFTVELQSDFSYAKWPVIILIILLAGGFITLFALRIAYNIKHREKKPYVPPLPVIVKRPIWQMKQDYLGRVATYYQQFNEGSLSIRDCYQCLSTCIREFVYEATEVDVTTKTLYEIKMWNIPNLAALIEEFYEPEFAKKSVGDANSAIMNTKRVIETWN